MFITHFSHWLIMSENIKPPIARREEKITKIHGIELKDDYFWLRYKENQEVIDYLKAENDYTKKETKHLDSFTDELFNEMKNRIKEDDETVPYKIKDYYYYSRTEKGKEYSIHCRKYKNLDNKEEILLDLNEMAKGHEYYKLYTSKISPNQNILAYSIDNTGYEKLVIYFKDLTTGEIFAEKLENVGWNFEWTDDKTLYYTIRDKAQRPYALKRHVLGTNPSEDALIFNEKDVKRNVSINKTKNQKFLLLSSNSNLSNEYHFLDLKDHLGKFVVFLPREEKHEYIINHKDGYFYIITNKDESPNFKLMRTSIDKLSKEDWEEIIAHNKDVRIDWIETFEDFSVISKREEGLDKFEIFYDRNDERNHNIEMPETVYGAWFGDNLEYSSDIFRFVYTSLITPKSIYDYSLKERKLKLKKQDEIKNYNKEDYVTERKYAIARDGTKVPISIVHKKSIVTPAPTLLYGYGSYGYPMDTYFSPSRVSLIERGIVFVIAHVRGGGELGRQWYDDGKFLKKKNTFFDFIDCAEYLLNEEITTKDKFIIQGASAGGLLVGAVMTMRPDLCHLVVAEVPFVDVVNSMLDASIPLTAGEWEEWGDPRKKDFFDYMLSYSPYDNIKAINYPHTLVTTGLNDPRVAFWEPAKFTAKLRALKTDKNELVLKTNMGAGHGGASGRYESMKEIAFIFSYVLDKMGLVDN